MKYLKNLKKNKRTNQVIFDISEDVVEHSNNSSVPAGIEDLSLHIKQLER